ncbi:hypothetical protein [Variovorax paradoxus]|uniref:hypothetical protein n=1 Tax=Variovorax paradoxus TaxID=34073 RepID=UPI001ABC4D5D
MSTSLKSASSSFRRPACGAEGCAGVAARIGWQLWSEPTEAQRALIGGEVLAQAHLYGAACAVLLVLAQAPRSRSPA